MDTLLNSVIHNWINPSSPYPDYDEHILNRYKRNYGGLEISYANQYIERIGNDKYVFKPSNIQITFETKTTPLPERDHWVRMVGGINVEINRKSKGNILIKGNDKGKEFIFKCEIPLFSFASWRMPYFLDIVKKFLDDNIEGRLRNLESLAYVGKLRKFPEDPEGVIASYLSGIDGPGKDKIPAHLPYHKDRLLGSVKPRLEGNILTDGDSKWPLPNIFERSVERPSRPPPPPPPPFQFFPHPTGGWNSVERPLRASWTAAFQSFPFHLNSVERPLGEEVLKPPPPPPGPNLLQSKFTEEQQPEESRWEEMLRRRERRGGGWRPVRGRATSKARTTKGRKRTTRKNKRQI